LDPSGDETARSLIERLQGSTIPNFQIVLCPNGRLLCNPTESDLALAIGVAGP